MYVNFHFAACTLYSQITPVTQIRKEKMHKELLWPSGMHNVERAAIHYMVWKVAGRIPELRQTSKSGRTSVKLLIGSDI